MEVQRRVSSVKLNGDGENNETDDERAKDEAKGDEVESAEPFLLIELSSRGLEVQAPVALNDQV